MAYDIKNKIKAPSFIRCVDAGTYTIALADLRANANVETITSASITDFSWSTSGFISVSRGGIPIFNVYGSGAWTGDDVTLRNAAANNTTGNVVIVINGGGTCMMQMNKNYTLNVDTQRVILNT